MTEFAVLGVLAVRPAHGFALSKELDASSEIGRVFTVRRPLVYRALDRLVTAGLAEPLATEKGDAGPQRVVHRITRRGRSRLNRWLAEPVEHVRDLRIGFLLKVALCERLARSPSDLIRDQRAALDETLLALNERAVADDDHVELWRRHSAAAAAAYLAELERRHPPPTP